MYRYHKTISEISAMKKIIKTIIYIIVMVAVFVSVYILASSHEVTDAVVGIGRTIFITVVVVIAFYLAVKYGPDDD